VYDLQKQADNSYIPVLVQVIRPDLSTAEKISEIEAKIGRYTPNYVVDTDEGCIYILGYEGAGWFPATYMPVAKIPLPSLSTTEYVFDADDVIDNYGAEPTVFAIQQPFYKDGKIYIQGGSAGNYNRGIKVLDLARKKIVTIANTRYVHAGEPQFIGLYKGKLLWYDAGDSGDLYEIEFN
jgi:meiotically up-regulated gene 157 (Mug157) protein